jgi:hypothetical protein
MGDAATTFWSPGRSTVLLTIWALLTPYRVNLTPLPWAPPPWGFDVVIYAGLWGYNTALNPIFGIYINPLYSFIGLVFCAPGLIMAWLVWQGTREEHRPRLQYYEMVVLLYVIQILLTFILPCPNIRTLCIPVPTTGIVALYLISRVVEDPEAAWSK